MEEAPLIPLLFHLPISLRHPSSSNIYPNVLSRSPSNRNPCAAKPSPLASVELCKDLAQTGLISSCSNLQGSRKSCTHSVSPCPTWEDQAAQGPGIPQPVRDHLGLPSTSDCRQQADPQTALPPPSEGLAGGSWVTHHRHGTMGTGDDTPAPPPRTPQQAGHRQGWPQPSGRLRSPSNEPLAGLCTRRFLNPSTAGWLMGSAPSSEV